LTDFKEFKEQEITSLFNAAKDEIDKISQPAAEKKKEVVSKFQGHLRNLSLRRIQFHL
jgi:hypothetical protein